MFLCNIKAKFFAVHLSCNSLLTFFPFSDSLYRQVIKNDIDTSVLLCFTFFVKLMISLAIFDGFWLLFKSFVSVCKITMSGFLAVVGLIQSFISCVAAPGNDFKTLKYSLRDWFKLRLGTFRKIESPITKTVFFLFFSVGVTSFFYPNYDGNFQLSALFFPFW